MRTLCSQIIGSREESDFVILNNLYSQQGVGADHIIAEVKNNGTSWNPFSLAAETNIWFYLEDIHLTISLFSGCFFILFQQSCMLSYCLPLLTGGASAFFFFKQKDDENEKLGARLLLPRVSDQE